MEQNQRLAFRRAPRHGFSRTIVLGLAAIVAGTILLMAAALVSAAGQSDAVAIERQALATRHAIEMSIDELALQQETVAIWDDSSQQLASAHPNLQWVHDNLGLWLHGIFNHDETFVLDGHDRPIYAASEGRRVSQSLYSAQEKDLRSLVDDLRRPAAKLGPHDRRKGVALPAGSTVRTTSRATHETRIGLLSNRPAALSAMLIQPSTPDYVKPRGQWPVLISVRFLDGEFLGQLSARQLIAAPRFSREQRHSPNEASITLADEFHRTIGYLIWRPDLPGTAVLGKLILPNLLVLILLISFILGLGWRLWKAVRDLAATERQATHSALHDPLTSLPNRAYFQRQLEEMVRTSSATGECFAVALVDVDEFKFINDTMGHDAGDALLATLAERLGEAVRAGDFIARLGGDEFAILYRLADRRELEEACQRLVERVNGPWEYEGKALDCRVTVGASPNDCRSSASEILKQADLALYECKAAARGQYRLYRRKMETAVAERQRMLASCSQALAGNLISPFYQPKVDLRSGEIIGFEALLRVRLADGQIGGPEQIQAAFENGALASEISRRMIELVLDDVNEWRRRRAPFGHVAINAGAVELRSRSFGTALLSRLRQKGVPPSLIQIEVTEGVLLDRGSEHVGKTFDLLAGAGVKLALDDFGTGFASLTHLKQFPIDLIKIDRHFVRDLQVDPEDGAIVEAILGLARALGLQVVAEGVETSAQRDFLAALGCKYGQGYLFGPAVPAAEVPDLLIRPNQAGRRAA